MRPDKIRHNPGWRAFSKLCRNSLWGKFCQKDDRLNTKLVSDPLHFYKRLNGADVEMHDIAILNDDLVENMSMKQTNKNLYWYILQQHWVD